MLILAVLALAASVFGRWYGSWQNQCAFVEFCKSHSGDVRYAYDSDAIYAKDPPGFLANALGADAFYSVVSCYIPLETTESTSRFLSYNERVECNALVRLGHNVDLSIVQQMVGDERLTVTRSGHTLIQDGRKTKWGQGTIRGHSGSVENIDSVVR